MQARLGERRGSRGHRHWLTKAIADAVRKKGVEKAAQEWAGIIDRLEQERIRDPLTGAFNRGFVGASLQQVLDTEAEYGHSVGLIMLDIDFFKSINDEEPDHHQAGDRTLVTLVKLLGKVCAMCTVGRWGGEEWIVIIPHALDRKVKQLATRVGKAIRRELAKRAKLTRSQVTASIGATLVGDGETAVAAVKRVDGLLYAAKEGGRARLVYQQIGGQVEVVKFA